MQVGGEIAVPKSMEVTDKAVLVTGANRGLGKALVEEILRRGAKRVYAGARKPLAHADRRVTPLILDVTDTAQIEAAVERVGSLDILINNAGIGLYDDLGDRAALERHLAVNLLGVHGVTDAFLPLLTRSRGAVVNILSEAALVPFPIIPSSMTQSLRALAGARGVSVHAVLSGPIDTDMSRDADIPKSSAESVAKGILDGMARGEEEIFPDPKSASMAESWRGSAFKALERQMAAFVQAMPAKS
jgi:NAD(P)-dependent dehydrogenase (short-subunit alcohol dehydrogenase family)